MNKDIKQELISAKNWILKNQKEDGEILWDDQGKWDFWDHCECLIALSIYDSISNKQFFLQFGGRIEHNAIKKK